jgi:serine/threonine protein kinase
LFNTGTAHTRFIILPAFDFSHPLLLLTELLDRDLKSFVESSKPVLSADGISFEPASITCRDQIDLCRQAAAGLAAIAEKRVVHRDFAARNCLVSVTKPPVLKVSDFGMARKLPKGSGKVSVERESLPALPQEADEGATAVYHVKGKGAMLPVRWMAPEAVFDMDFYLKSDVWSLGVVIIEVFSWAAMPYPLLTNAQVIDFVLSGKRDAQPVDCPDEVYNRVVLPCWEQDQKLRPHPAKCAALLAQLNIGDPELTLTFSKRVWTPPHSTSLDSANSKDAFFTEAHRSKVNECLTRSSFAPASVLTAVVLSTYSHTRAHTTHTHTHTQNTSIPTPQSHTTSSVVHLACSRTRVACRTWAGC